MGKYFGTDGFRGKAGVVLTAQHAFQTGRFLGWYYGKKHLDDKAKIVIGKDTRRSSYMYDLGGEGELINFTVTVVNPYNIAQVLPVQVIAINIGGGQGEVELREATLITAVIPVIGSVIGGNCCLSSHC